MKKILALLLFLLFILCLWFGWIWYKNTVLCCTDNVKVGTKVNVAPTLPVKYGPLVFNWNSEKTVLNDLWPGKKSQILSGNADNKILQITGPYYEDEVNNTSFDNLGLARADAIKQLLLDSLSADKIEVTSKLTRYSADAKTKAFGGAVLNWNVRNDNVKEIDSKALIYFPYNSAEKLDNNNIDDYLASIVENLKGNDKKITLTGHTDNIGNAGYNKKLGLTRAKALKSILVKLGVDADRITVASQGQSQPIASNDNEEGRKKNRRVELEIK